MKKKPILRKSEREALNELKAALSQQLELIDFRLFGSKARGDSTTDSDMDVMLVLEDVSPEIRQRVFDIIYEIDLKYDSLISPVLYARRDLEEGPFSESPLYRNAVSEGIPL
jgi:predicted nucleotidyltransferase